MSKCEHDWDSNMGRPGATCLKCGVDYKPPRKPKVLFTVATTGTLCNDLAASLICWSRDDRVDLLIQFVKERPLANALNKMALMMLNGGYDWWIAFDSDQCCLKNPIDLIFTEESDIKSCPAPIWGPDGGKHIPICWNAFHEPNEGHYRPVSETAGVQRVDVTGNGAMVIPRRVIESIKAPFLCTYDENGVKTAGSDISFCRKARKAGFTIACDFDYPCTHFQNVDITEVWGLLTKIVANQANASKRRMCSMSGCDERDYRGYQDWLFCDDHYKEFKNRVAAKYTKPQIQDWIDGKADNLSNKKAEPCLT